MEYYILKNETIIAVSSATSKESALNEFISLKSISEDDIYMYRAVEKAVYDENL